MNYRRTKYGAAGLIMAGMLALSGCGSQGDTADPEQTSESLSQEPEKETQETTEISSDSEEESTEGVEKPEEQIESEEPEKPEEQIESEEPEDTSATENEETTPIEQKADAPIQGKYPAQISLPESNGEKKSYFFDEDGDLIRVETENEDGTVSKEERTYVLDEQGSKVYGLTENGLLDTCDSYDYSALAHKIAEKPLVQLIQVTHSEQGLISETAFSYDAENRIIKRTINSTIWGQEDSEYTYEAQGENMIVTFAESGDVYTFQYNKDGYLMSESGSFEDSSFDYAYAYSYDENNWLTAVSENRATKESETLLTLDDAGNILRCESTSGFAQEYEGYDANGNWTTCTYYKGDGEMDCFLVSEYDDRGNLLTKSFGIGTELRTVSYHYDADGRLNDISVDEKVLYQFSYNDEGLLERMEKVNEYEESNAEKEAEIYGYVLWQEVWQDAADYAGKYTGIGGGRATVISYYGGAVFTY